MKQSTQHRYGRISSESTADAEGKDGGVKVTAPPAAALPGAELHTPYSKYVSRELKKNPEALPEINEKFIQGP